MDSDSSDSERYSESDSNGDSYSGWPWFNLWLGFVMAQNAWAGEYINSKYGYFCPDSDSSDTDSYNDSDSDGDD